MGVLGGLYPPNTHFFYLTTLIPVEPYLEMSETLRPIKATRTSKLKNPAMM